MMATDDGASDDSSNKVSDNENNSLLVRVWLSFRKMMARFWALLLKPFQLLKSLLTKIDKDKKDVSPAAEDETKEEPVVPEVRVIPEGVAITEVENIAVVEEVEEKEVLAEIESNVADVAAVAEEQITVDDQKAEPVEASPADESIAAIPTDTTDSSKPTNTDETTPRQATARPNVDLTGNWTLIVDDTFTSQYDEYLRKLGQPMLVRTVALTVIGSTKEETIQTGGGQMLYIRGMNVRGSWERTLEASEQIMEGEQMKENVHAVEGHELKPMTTADGENVEVASWWESNGAVHHSWVVGGEKYGGGDFENKRYLTDNGNILVCESTFHPMGWEEDGREDAFVKWRFLREGAIYGDGAWHLPNIFDVLKKDEKGSTTGDAGGDNNLLPKSGGIIVGDIMDNVATSQDEANALSNTTDDNAASMVAVKHSMSIDEAIERESWVPPVGDRWAIAAPGVDLTGKWKLIITEQFKKEYDEFLESLDQPLIVRGAAVVLIGNTREETKQLDGGRSLYIKGINAKGVWERTLTSSGSDFDTTMSPNPSDGSYDQLHIQVPIVTADSEKVVAESWWEADGSVHVSWTYGVKRYGGGSFESKRYLENDGDVYVCESTFHPDDTNTRRETSVLKWKFLREGTAFMLTDQ